MEITGKKQFPGFLFFRRGGIGAWQSKRRLPEKNCASEDQDLGGCDMPSPIQEPKWKSWLNLDTLLEIEKGGFMGKLLLLLCVSAGLVWSQSTTGTLVGTVTDSSGAVVAGAKVKVTNEGTGIGFSTVTNSSGDYVVPNLAAASYTIQIEVPGFRTAEIKDIRLLLNTTVRTDVRMETGALEQTVTVSAAAPVLSSETSSIATVVDSHSMVTLPLNGR